MLLSSLVTGFLYFAYGSNMLTARLHIKNPSAVYINIGKLEDYRLDFLGTSKTWGGSPATIVPTRDSHVWGVIYALSNDDMASLDRQEGRKYEALNVTVTSRDGQIYHCRTYKRKLRPAENIPLSQLPKHRRPTEKYLNTIIDGAKEHGLPRGYVRRLESIKHLTETDEIE